MHYWKRVFWITGLIGFIGLVFLGMSLFLASKKHKSITLPNGQEISFVAATAGTDRCPDPSLLNRLILNRVSRNFRSSRPLLRKFGFSGTLLPPPVFPSASEDDFTFWILTRSDDGKSFSNNIKASPDGTVTLRWNVLEFRAEESNKLLNIKGTLNYGSNNGKSFYGIHLPNLRNQTSRVIIQLRHDNDRGVSEELATWKVDIP